MTCFAQGTETFTSSGTFTVPAGVTTVNVDAWGGGGAGGGVNGAFELRAGGGGGGGTFTRNAVASVTPGQNITVTIGDGGLGFSKANGGAGGTSTFASTVPVTAIGGSGGELGGPGKNIGSGAAAAVGVTYSGGAGGTRTSGFRSGGGGGGAGSSGNGGDGGSGTGGAGGDFDGGAGAAGLIGIPGNGISAIAVGGGGGGAYAVANNDRTGGNGFRGQIIVTWECPGAGELSGTQTICPGGTSELSSSVSGGTWSTSDGDVATVDETTGVVTAVSVGSATITYTIAGVGGCESATATLEITVDPLPVANFLVNDVEIADGGTAEVCNGSDVKLNLTSDPEANYTLEFDGNTIASGAVGSGIEYIFSVDEEDEGEYTLTLTTESGCESVSKYTLTVNQPGGLTSFGASGTIPVLSGANDIIANCGLIGKITSDDIAGSGSPSLSVTTTEQSGGRKYTLTPGDGTEYDADIVLYFSQDDFDAFNAASDVDLPTVPTDLAGIANLRILHTGTSTETMDPADIVWNASENWWEVSFTVTHFSSFELAAIDTPLPVTLTEFKAIKNENTTLLTWSTVAETNSEAFNVEHSANGKAWKTLGLVQAKGESKAFVPYSFQDINPTDGENLYRLKMVDSDGTFAYSRIVSVKFEGDETAAVFPNPVSDILQINIRDLNIIKSVKMIDLNGRSVYTSGSGQIAKSINIKGIPSGLYLVEIVSLNGQVRRSKITVTR